MAWARIPIKKVEVEVEKEEPTIVEPLQPTEKKTSRRSTKKNTQDVGGN